MPGRFEDWALGWLRPHQKLAAVLYRALAVEQDRLTPEKAGWVREYIDHGEYELALDQLSETLSELDLGPRPETDELMREAAAMMGLRGVYGPPPL